MMEVQFHRTGERRYAIKIIRKDHPALEMNTAPGYDSIMPHDLLHLVVESELGLRRGIFGQIADGGTAGTFHTVASNDENKRDAARRRRRVVKRGDKLLRQGRDESVFSEEATSLCFYEWLSRSPDPARRKRAAEMFTLKKQIQDLRAQAEDHGLTEERILRICARLDEVSSRWASLEIGESMSVSWPGNT